MSYMKVSGAVAAAVTALALSGSAYGDGKSPNGPPGPAGNPNQPAAAPQANGPQGPAGNDGGSAPASKGKSQPKGRSNSSHGRSESQPNGRSDSSHGRSESQPKGRSDSSHGKGQSQSHRTRSQANPNPGTPRKGGREDRPAGKITICHATRSSTNPYVQITISVNGLNGHGPAGDSRHHAGSWKDIIPAPAEGCPSTVQPPPATTTEQPPATTTTTLQPAVVAPAPEVAAAAPAATPAATPATETPQQAVLGEQVSGTAPAAAGAPGASKVLGAQASGSAPKAAVAARAAGQRSGSLPFTGLELVFVLLAAAAALLGGFTLRRVTASR